MRQGWIATLNAVTNSNAVRSEYSSIFLASESSLLPTDCNDFEVVIVIVQLRY